MDDVVDDIVDDDEELPSREGCDGDEILDVGCCFISHPIFLTHISSMIDHPWPPPLLGAWL